MDVPRRGVPRVPGRPLVLGHRGTSADAPENTLAAFRRAMDDGADGVELDVWRCATGEVVVFHDDDASRIAASPVRIARASLAELRALDVGAHRGAAFRGERIPLLAEVLEALPGAVVNVELKSGGRDLGLAAATAQVILRARAEDRVVVSSFDYRLVSAFRAAAPRLPVGLLFESGHRWRLRTWLAARLLHAEALHPERVLVTAERAAAWRAGGLALNVWTVDAAEEIERLVELGATAIISNVPGKAREVVRRKTGR
jgi:glycerophosphoryl diester phosphodiesterase